MKNSPENKEAKRNRCIQYTPSFFARSNLIYLQAAGEHYLEQSEFYEGEISPTYLFFLVVEGIGELKYDENEYELASRVCGFLDCRKSYRYGCTGETLNIQFIYFYGSNMTGIYENYMEEGYSPCFYVPDTKTFMQICRQVRNAAAHPSCMNEMRIYEKLTSLLTLLMKCSEGCGRKNSRATQKQDLQKVKDYLDQNYDKKITLDALAEKFYINKYYLTRLFKEQFGISVNSYLIQVRIKHARQLLRFTDMSVEQIGLKCGIGDANYFSRVFKKQEGITPGEFRRKWSDSKRKTPDGCDRRE